jgi:hypothetical protein
VRARPSVSFYHRPVCVVEELRGRYRGCGSWDPVTSIVEAHEVLLRYPDGSAKWHFGPASPEGTVHRIEWWEE